MIIFDGRQFAQRKEKLLRKKVNKLLKKGVRPKLASILVGEDPASKLYVSLKKKAAERVGAELQVISLSLPAQTGSSTSTEKISSAVQELNSDSTVHGIMVQLPLPSEIRGETSAVLNSISPEKDVDGLRDDSPFVPATVKAILEILKVAMVPRVSQVVVIGSEGMVGRRLIHELRIRNYETEGVDRHNAKSLKLKAENADVLISATGVPNLIKGDMVKKGAVVIDLGAPYGDVDFVSVAKKASFITPVPGGVGPVTVVSLLENLLIAVENK